MALVTLNSPLAWPGFNASIAGGPGLGTAGTLSSAGHYVAYVFVAKEDMVVSHVGFQAGTAAGSPTITVGIEALSSTGFPSGSAGFGSTNATTGTVSSNSYVLTALGGSATISRGTSFAVKMALASGTSQIIQQFGSVSLPVRNNNPYIIVNTGTPTKFNLADAPLIALGSNSTTFYAVPAAIPVTATAGNTFNNTSSAKRGLKFTIPFNCRVIGVRTYITNAIGDFNIGFYDSAGSGVGSTVTAFDGDYHVANNAGSVSFYFSTPITLTAGTSYRVAIEPTTATNTNITTMTLPSVDYYSATSGGSSAVTYTTFATSSWTDSTTQIPMMDILIDQIDNGAGSGGVVGVIGG